MNQAPTPPPPPARPSDTDAFSGGKFALGCAIPIIALVVTFLLLVVFVGVAYQHTASKAEETFAIVALAAPGLLLLALEVYFVVTRKRELAIGNAIGIAMIVLLLGACFGLLGG